MKILQIGPYPPPMGGWAFHIKVFRNYLLDRAHDCKVLNIGESRKTTSDEFISVNSGLDFVGKTIRYVCSGYLVYNHIDGMAIKGFLLALGSQLISLLFARRPLLSFHAGIHQKCFDKRYRVHRVLAKMIFTLSRRIICNSAEVKERIVELGVGRHKIHAVPCFSSQYLAHKHTLTETQSDFIGRHNPILFTFIKFVPDYTVDLLLQTVSILRKKHRDLGLIVVESGNHSDQLEKLFDRLKLRSCVFLTGDLSHDNFLTLLAKSHLYIRTPLSDGVCSSVLEAINLKTPVVASENSTRPDGVITFRGGDQMDLVLKVEYALKHRDRIAAGLKENLGSDNLLKEFEILSAAWNGSRFF
jgi:glycosyltransferase involved in cell wall biosynthesis